MQSAKDSFYVALRERLASFNPARSITLEGTEQPAILVVENEPVTALAPLADCFYLVFGAVRLLAPRHEPPLFALDCTVRYRTSGSGDDARDRGRTLATLDAELLAITTPPRTPHANQVVDASAEFGTTIFWDAPQFEAPDANGAQLVRAARMTIFFYAKEQSA